MKDSTWQLTKVNEAMEANYLVDASAAGTLVASALMA